MRKILLSTILFLAPALAHSYQKTIEYSVPVSTERVAGDVTRAFPEFNMNIPDRLGEFSSVIAYVTMIDSVTAANSPPSIIISAGIDSVAHSTVSLVDTITNTNEGQSFLFISSFTGYFNANFTGTNHKVRIHSTLGSGSGTTNAYAKFILTYKADPNATTRIKTVRIPVQSATGTIVSTYLELGNGLTNQIPALDSYLPESNKVFRNMFFEYHVNEGFNSTGLDPQICFQIDSLTEVCDAPHDDGLNSARFMYGQLNLSSMTTSTAHAIKARQTSTNMPLTGLGGVLIVTYEYNHETSTEIFNSLMVTAADVDGYMGGATSADATRFSREFFIGETDPVLKQSGVLFSLGDPNATTVALYAGNQVAHSTYATSGAVLAGGKAFVHRVDTNNGFSIRKGTNTFVLNFYRTSASAGSLGSNPSALLYLNYVSSKSAMGGGDLNHAHTVIEQLQPMVADAALVETISTATIITEPYYWLHAANYWIWIYHGVVAHSINLSAEVQSGELEGDGWRGFYNGIIHTDGEIGPSISFSRSADAFKKYPDDPDPLMDIETARKYRFQSINGSYFQSYMFVTYRTSTYTVTGTVSNYSGDGSGIEINIHRSDTNELIGSATTVAGGGFTFIWYDDTIPVYAQASEATGYKGRSESGIAGADALDFDLSCDACVGGGGTNWGTINNATINNMTQGAP